MAAAVWLRTTVKAPAGAADGGHRLSLRVGEDRSRSALPDQRKPIEDDQQQRGFRRRAGRSRTGQPSSTDRALVGVLRGGATAANLALMIRAVAYKMQERVIGGLSAATRRLLCAEEPAPVRRRRGLRPGTVLVREWHGVAHQVTIVEQGVIYRGEHHRCLSEVARPITV